MKKLCSTVMVLLFVCVVAFAQGQPSAKFAIVWEDTPLIAITSAETCDPANDDFDFDRDSGVLLATMKMPSGKEILAGISAESVILLNTRVTAKNGGSGTATAFGSVRVRIKAVNLDTGDVYWPVPDGRIVLNMRMQQLSAKLGGVIEECTVGDDGVIDVGTECTVTPEEIGLLTASASANHFNVVFPDLPQGTYKIRARFVVVSASAAAVTAVDPAEACAYAGSVVVLKDRIVTLQDVRAVKGSIETVEIE